MSEYQAPTSGEAPPSRGRTLALCAVILGVAAAITAYIFSSEPEATRTSAMRSTAMLVEVTPVVRGDFRPEIVAMGTVEPARDITLAPRVGGEVIERGANFVPGGFVAAGELLLRIDPADYGNALRQRRSALRQAEADLQVEMGRQNVARQDYQLLADTLSAENEALILRRPQLNAARARVEAARASLAQAELEWERTRIRAPFDAHVLSRHANVGSQVSPGENLGRLVGLDTFWIAATVPVSKLRWLAVPETDADAGARVVLRDRSAWPDSVTRLGHVHRLVGALSERTRMARVLVAVPDPMARRGAAGRPPLMIGAFIEAHMQARPIPGVVRLARDFVRQGDTVWVMEEGKLRIRPVEILFQDAVHAYISTGLEDGDRVVTTNLSTVVDGADLRL